MPEHQFGGFVAAVPPPLTIGSVTLDDGSSVKGFLCESAAVSASVEITGSEGGRDTCARDARPSLDLKQMAPQV